MEKTLKSLGAIFALVILFAFPSCSNSAGGGGSSSSGSGGGGSSISESEAESYGEESTDQGNVSGETTAIKVNGVTVNFGEQNFVLAEDETQNLTVTKKPSKRNKSEGWDMDIYEINLGNKHQLNDFVELRIPYDTSKIDSGQAPKKCISARYMNNSGEWVALPYHLDTSRRELVIETDHFSYFGVFYVQNEGQPNAFIEEILQDPDYMSSSETLAISKKIANDDGGVAACLKAGVEKFFSTSDDASNIISIMTGGTGAVFEKTFEETLGEAFTAVGYANTAYNLSKIVLGVDSSDSAKLSLMHDVASKAVQYGLKQFTAAGAEALSLGFAAVWIFQKILFDFGEEAQSQKYKHWWQGYIMYTDYNKSENSHKVRKIKDWRDWLINELEEGNYDADDAETVKNVFEEELDNYARDFFRQKIEDQIYWINENTSKAGFAKAGDITKEVEDTMVNDYKIEFRKTTMPQVFSSVARYKAKKAWSDAMQEIAKNYGKKIRFHIKEEVSEDGPAYAGYKYRFAPLNKSADKDMWTGTIKDSGEAYFNATAIGVITSLKGQPFSLEIYTPTANLDSAKPVMTIPVQIKEGENEIVIKPELTIDGFMGTWYTQYEVEYDGETEVVTEKHDMSLSSDQKTIKHTVSYKEGGKWVYPSTVNVTISDFDASAKTITGTTKEGNNTYTITYKAKKSEGLKITQMDLNVTGGTGYTLTRTEPDEPENAEFAVGNIIYSDGSISTPDNYNSKKKAVAIIYDADKKLAIGVKTKNCTWDEAKTFCKNYGDGFYMPSIEEIEPFFDNYELLFNVFKKVVSNFTYGGGFWSSTEASSGLPEGFDWGDIPTDYLPPGYEDFFKTTSMHYVGAAMQGQGDGNKSPITDSYPMDAVAIKRY